MVTINSTFNIAKGKGRGATYKLLEISASNWGTAGSGLYATGGAEILLTTDEAKEVVAVIGAPVLQSGPWLLNLVSKSGRAIKLIGHDIVGGSGSAYQQIAAKTKISGTVIVELAAIIKSP